MNKLISVLSVNILLLQGLANAQDVQRYTSGQMLLRFTQQAYDQLVLDTTNGQITTSISVIDSLCTEYQISGIKKLFPVSDESKLTTGIYRSYLISFSNYFSVDDVTEAFEACDSLVEHAQPNYIGTMSAVPNDPKYSNFNNNVIKQWNLERVKMPFAWDIEKGCPDIRIAILDVGFKIDHEDLSSKFSTLFRYDAVNVDLSSISPTQTAFCTEDYVDVDSDPNSFSNHGTLVAGIAAAGTDNGIGIAGVGWDIEIVPVRIAFRTNETPTGFHTSDNLCDGIRWVIDNQAARVINMSIQNPDFSQDVQDAITDAIANNIVVVASSGNAGSTVVLYPAGYAGVIAVGATKKNNNRWAGSSYGNHLSLVAPGKKIVTTTFKIDEDDCSLKNKKYDNNVTGTTMAAPHVAGAAALILSRNSSLTPADVRNILESTATAVSGMNNQVPHIEYGHGLLDVHAALLATPPVQNNLVISGITFPPPNAFEFVAAMTITGGPNVTINPPADITFRAGQQVRLLPGFHAKAGSRFHAFIDPSIIACSTSNKTDGSSSGGENDTIEVEKSEPEKELVPSITESGSSVKIYPNPNTGQFYVEVKSSEETTSSIYVYDLLGNTIGRLNNSPNTLFDIDISTHPKGIYFVKVVRGDQVFTEKIIIR